VKVNLIGHRKLRGRPDLSPRLRMDTLRGDAHSGTIKTHAQAVQQRGPWAGSAQYCRVVEMWIMTALGPRHPEWKTFPPAVTLMAVLGLEVAWCRPFASWLWLFIVAIARPIAQSDPYAFYDDFRSWVRQYAAEAGKNLPYSRDTAPG
jgi:hypothetical protein